MSDLTNQKRLLSNLLQALNAQYPEDDYAMVETHISSILLGPRCVYKIKKPVDFGFLDFSTLAKRKQYCEEEIRLNGRLAPSIYLQAVAITGSIDNPSIEGDGEAIDYAVKMRRFDERGELDRLLAQGQLDETLIKQLADRIARFHQHIPAVAEDEAFGTPDHVLAPMLENFVQIRAIIDDEGILHQLGQLEQWTRQQFEQLQSVLSKRRTDGFIRECHGDLHLGNIAYSDGQLIIFDGIEFNANLRWIDVISELAFLTMDLSDHGASGLAYALLNRYLEQTGDYPGLQLLNFYQAYRALVRAKVAALGLGQAGDDGQRQQLMSTCHGYVDLAERFTQPASPALIVMAGYSASGKSMISGLLLQRLGAIRLRSDRERKRLFDAASTTDQGVNEGLYHPQLTAKTYQHLQQLAGQLLGQGFNVIVDATFLKTAQRRPFQHIAQQLGCNYRVLWQQASPATLLQRLQQREQDKDNISDATQAVLQQQMAQAEIPGEDENTVVIDTEETLDSEAIGEQLKL